MKHEGFTRGPWNSDIDEERDQIVIFEDYGLQRHIAYLPLHSMPPPQQSDNAALLLDAPRLCAENVKLREALEGMIWIATAGTGMGLTQAKRHAAIATAHAALAETEQL